MAAAAIPNNTFVHNLEEKIKLEPLTEALSALFGAFGTVIDIVAKKSLKRKGQAFIVYETREEAARAMEETQGFELFDKAMKVEYARTKSDATVLREGDDEAFEKHKRARLAEKERKQALEAQQQAASLKRPPPTDPSLARPAKTTRGAGLKATAPSAPVVPDEYLPPNKILFVQNVPEDYDVEALSAIFARFEGFREVRQVPGRKGLAFVEYEAESGAISAKEGCAGMVLSGQAIRVTFQRQ
ncbi:RNA recognition domain-containing protein [Patellaria atrata CBS 101060]|uniref:RNA recognition domain-containing protein n=1 Tax=Patellaria atrata CBS 101060 TaxID=1346257 RepID=A0A9P4SAD5_9PEZI|nr:RNA recognition domain-containing protein [Patellaria atrata CBS 101060]